VRWVIARTAAYATIVVRIERQTSGELAAWPGQDGPPLPPPAFAAPPVRAPDVGRDAPTELRTRPPLAFCGAERLANPDDYDAAARRCFVDGVLAWVPVELISIEASTGAVPVTTVLRFTGRGAIRRYVRSEQPWAAVDCALGRIATPAAFVITSPCDRHELRP
jgi:hypothetical protein